MQQLLHERAERQRLERELRKFDRIDDIVRREKELAAKLTEIAGHREAEAVRLNSLQRERDDAVAAAAKLMAVRSIFC